VSDGRLSRDGVAHGLDPINDVAIEWALRAREAGAIARVIVVTIGPETAVDSLRRALAIGADESVLVTDPQLAGADVRTTARALAAVATHVGASLVVGGYESLDGSSGAVPAATAAVLGWPVLSRVRDASIEGTAVRASRDLGRGPTNVTVDLPLVASFVEGSVVPRYPKLKDVLRTRAAEPTVFAARDLGLSLPAIQERAVRLVEVPQPRKEPVVLTIDEGVEALFELVTSANGSVGND
jgi:electron transfer flavoprotein beta subunit